jgi:hypothetical protein
LNSSIGSRFFQSSAPSGALNLYSPHLKAIHQQSCQQGKCDTEGQSQKNSGFAKLGISGVAVLPSMMGIKPTKVVTVSSMGRNRFTPASITALYNHRAIFLCNLPKNKVVKHHYNQSRR